MYKQPDISCAGTLVRFDLGFERLPFRRIPKGREKLIRRELLGPLRERVTQGWPEVRVHVVIRQDVEAARPRGFPERLNLPRLPDAAVLRIVVTDLDGTAGALADLDAFSDGVHDRLALPADVRGVEAVMAGDNLCELDDFLRRREASGRID